jgi:hypothetical protein
MLLAQTARRIRSRLMLGTAAALNQRDFANYRVNLFHAAPAS